MELYSCDIIFYSQYSYFWNLYINILASQTFIRNDSYKFSNLKLSLVLSRLTILSNFRPIYFSL